MKVRSIRDVNARARANRRITSCHGHVRLPISRNGACPDFGANA
jgi:hypothetical protein